MHKTIKNPLSIRTLGAGALALAFGFSAGAQSVAKTEKVPAAGLYELAVSEKTGAVYVAAAGSRTAPGGKILKLDPATLAVVDSISLKDTPPFGVGINNKTQTLYTSNTRTNSVSAIDLKSGKVLATITNGKEKSHTREIRVDEAKNLVYVTDVGGESAIWVIDGKTNKFSHLIENTGKSTTGLALDPSGKTIYVTNMGTDEIGVIDVASRKLVKSYPAGGKSPVNLVLDAKTNRLFVANQGSDEVTVVNALNGELIKTIPAGKGTLGITFNPAKKLVYTANRQDGTVTVINSDTYAVTATLQAGSMPNTIVVNTKTGSVFATNKAKSAPRPKPGEPAPAPVVDNAGDTVSLIVP